MHQKILEHLNQFVPLIKSFLQFKAVHLECLDQNKDSINHASGFIIEENGKIFLYTCWHVVTGFDMHNMKYHMPPNRKYIRINLQDYEIVNQNVSRLGGSQFFDISLYHEDGNPVWIQEDLSLPDPMLENFKINVPLLCDLVKIELSKEIRMSTLQILCHKDKFLKEPSIGDKVFIVGYPYGYSVLGKSQPTPVVLTRFIASENIEKRFNQKLIDSACAHGMSGSPVFTEWNNGIYLCGMYTGVIYPDHVIKQNEKTTSLGTINSLLGWWIRDKTITSENLLDNQFL